MNRLTLAVSRVLQRLSRIGGPMIGAVLGGRAHRLMSRQLLLLAFTGRKTGRRYKTPVSYVREGSDLLVPGGGRWWKNLESGPVAVRLQGMWLPVAPEVIANTDAVAEVLARMMAASPAVSVFTGIRRGSDGRPDAQSLDREMRRGFVIVRLVLEDTALSANVARSAVA